MSADVVVLLVVGVGGALVALRIRRLIILCVSSRRARVSAREPRDAWASMTVWLNANKAGTMRREGGCIVVVSGR